MEPMDWGEHDNNNMNEKLDKAKQREYLTKILMMSIFLTGFALFIFWKLQNGTGLANFQLSWLDLVLLSLATYRLGRLIAYDVVMEPIRRPFTRTVPDSTGAGDTVEPRGSGTRKAMGQLISCPICTGTWVAALLVYALYAFPGPARVFLAMTAAIGAAELLNSLTEILCWSGQYARTLTGMRELARKRQSGDEQERSKLLMRETQRNGKDNQASNN